MTDLKALAEQVSKSHALRSSMVDFLPDLLMKYAEGEITAPQLAALADRATRDKQFYFFRMPKDEIRANQKLFRREFAFADALGELLSKPIPSGDTAAFDEGLARVMSDYLHTMDESEEKDSNQQ